MLVTTHPCPCGALVPIEPDAPGSAPRLAPHGPPTLPCPASGATLPLPLATRHDIETVAALAEALATHAGNVREAARSLAISAPTAHRHLARLHLAPLLTTYPPTPHGGRPHRQF